MTKFFDSKTKTLYITSGKTPETALSDNPLIELTDTPPYKHAPLRRSNAMGPKTQLTHYVSTTYKIELTGTYDKNHRTSADLVEVENTIVCP